MLLPDLKQMTGRNFYRLREPRLPPRLAMKKSTFTRLELSSDLTWNIAPSALRSVLCYCPVSRYLRCQISFRADFSGPHESRVSSNVRPRELTDVFAPVSKTLEEHCILPCVLTYQVNFSGLHELTDLQISSCCLLPPGPPCEVRNLLYSLLPRKLKHLRVSSDTKTEGQY
jgi:hypothetical protein